MKNQEKSGKIFNVMGFAPQYLPYLSEQVKLPWRTLNFDPRKVDVSLALYI